MYTFPEVLQDIKAKFPGFKVNKEMEGLSTVIFSFLTIYFLEAFDKGDQGTIKNIPDFINRIVIEGDKESHTAVCEVFLGIHDSGEDYETRFVKDLSLPAKNMYQRSIDLWSR